MKRIILLLALFLGVVTNARAQSVTNIRFDGKGDSSLRTIFNVSSAFTGLRIRYGTSSCSGGTGGTVLLVGTSIGTFGLYDVTATLSGLAPNTLYYVCPEVTSGGSYSSGISNTVTTLPRTQILPTPATPVSLVFPTQGPTTHTVLSDCSNFQAQLNAAAYGDTVLVPAGTICAGSYTLPAASDALTFAPSDVVTSTGTINVNTSTFTTGQQIRLSAGAANTDYLPGSTIYPYGLNTDLAGGWIKGGTYYANVVNGTHLQVVDVNNNPVLPGWIQFTCNTGTNNITFVPIWQTASGYAAASTAGIPANTMVQFASPGALCGGLSPNTNYYLLTACPASTSNPCVTQVSRTSGGSAVTLTSSGTGNQVIVDQGSGTMGVMPWPPANQWVVVKTMGTLPPFGIPVMLGGSLSVEPTTPWDSQMFQIKQNTCCTDGSPILQTGLLSHNWLFEGTYVTTASNTDYTITTDPTPYGTIIWTYQDSANILFLQSRVHGQGFPNRFGSDVGLTMNGTNIGWVDSEMDGLDYWHPWFTGLTMSTSGATNATIAAGTAYGGAFTTTTTTNAIITKTGGTVTGTGYVYLAMDGTMKVVLPTGMTATCTITGTTCTVSTAASPAYPTVTISGSARIACIQIGTITLSGGSITGVSGQGGNNQISQNDTEGSQAFVNGVGPGPYVFQNDWIEGTGIPLHFDDSGGAFASRHDYNIIRNVFNQPPSEMAGGPQSNGLKYFNRQPIEWKGGQRINLSGNIFQNCFSEDNPNEVCVANTPRSQGYVTDVSATNNSFINSVGGFNTAEVIDSDAPVSKPSQRQFYSNNLFQLIGDLRGAAASAGVAGNGWSFYGGYATEDMILTHNTIYNNLGYQPFTILVQNNAVGGFQLTDNLISRTTGSSGTGNVYHNSTGIPTPSGTCSGQDYTGAQCTFTAGPGNPSYLMAGNIGVPGYTAYVGNGVYSGQYATVAGFCTDWGSPSCSGPLYAANGFVQVMNGSGVPNSFALLNLINPANGNFGALPSSPMIAGAHKSYDGTDIGVNMPALLQAQGTIQSIHPLNITGTTATINAFVPDAGAACYAGYGTTNNPSAWTWTSADTTASRIRNISLTGLTAHTIYYYSLGCAHVALPAMQSFGTN